MELQLKVTLCFKYCGIKGDVLPAIAEVNEEKFGAYTPGTRLEWPLY